MMTTANKINKTIPHQGKPELSSGATTQPKSEFNWYPDKQDIQLVGFIQTWQLLIQLKHALVWGLKIVLATQLLHTEGERQELQ